MAVTIPEEIWTVPNVEIPETLSSCVVRLVAVAIPNDGVTNVGLVANTAEPEPVSSVSAAAN